MRVFRSYSPVFIYKAMPKTEPEVKNKNQSAPSPDVNNDKSSPSQDQKQIVWGKVDAVYNAAKEAFFHGTSTIDDVLLSLITTLQEIKSNETQNLGGLGTTPANGDLLGNELDQQQPEQP
jgi:hypothetical protein